MATEVTAKRLGEGQCKDPECGHFDHLHVGMRSRCMFGGCGCTSFKKVIPRAVGRDDSDPGPLYNRDPMTIKHGDGTLYDKTPMTYRQDSRLDRGSPPRVTPEIFAPSVVNASVVINAVGLKCCTICGSTSTDTDFERSHICNPDQIINWGSKRSTLPASLRPSLSVIQFEINAWAVKNFGEVSVPLKYKVAPLLGVIEESGEFAAEILNLTISSLLMKQAVGKLTHEVLKASQGIRGTEEEHLVRLRDAIGDLIIFLCGFCAANGWELDEIINATWSAVKERDWKKNKEDGKAI